MPTVATVEGHWGSDPAIFLSMNNMPYSLARPLQDKQGMQILEGLLAQLRGCR